MDITEIKNYDELLGYMDDNDIAAPYFCLDAREVPYSAVYAYDTFEEGTVPSCLESWEIMRAVNGTRRNPIFSDQDIEAEKRSSIKLNGLRERYNAQSIDKVFLNLVYDDKWPLLTAANYTEELAGKLPEGSANRFLEVWSQMKTDGASASWLASTFEALLPLYDETYYSGSFFPFVADHLERSWADIQKLGFSPSEAMPIISALTANDLSGISFWGSRLQDALEKFHSTDYYKGYPNVPEERIRSILTKCPNLLYGDRSSSDVFAEDQVKPLIAAGFSDDWIAEIFKTYKEYPFAMGSIEKMLDNLNKLKISAQDRYEMLVYIARKFAPDDVGLASDAIANPYSHMAELNKLRDPADIKWLLYFCIDHAERQADGALAMASELAKAGWGAGKIAMFIKALSKDSSSPTYESVAQTALAFEEMGVPDFDSLYFFEEMFKNPVTGFGWDFRNNAPAIVEGLRRTEKIS